MNPYGDYWLARELDMPVDWDAGDTSRGERMERIRRHILDNELADVVVKRTRKDGGLTAAMLFQRCFGTPLQTDELNFAGTGTEGA